MSDLEFLNGEATIASASAPADMAIRAVASAAPDRFDILIGDTRTVSRLTRSEALAAIMSAGSVFSLIIR